MKNASVGARAKGLREVGLEIADRQGVAAQIRAAKRPQRWRAAIAGQRRV
ncbi:MAG: hypothetical protein N2644_06050 [Candidatus Sumerlaea chitinivorans]|uniref:Uncharacterized protein n=1 Tax=Sumerlaea chitinivorans TaxID=2250252 RepID=A0A2Z4Y7E0_SUMC1|nr:hypothetical protein BRCON_2361 [Candidatus Sumerlaea chitinivorans]MCX7964027.1 hypothetical protein [Candidatus Sumerlaea chitinivorans]